MHIVICSLSGLLLLVAGCAGSAAVQTAPPPQASLVTAPTGGISQAAVASEVARLRAALEKEVPQDIIGNAESDAAWVSRAKVVVASAAFAVTRPQLLVVVDRNPRVQELRIILARPAAAWEVIGGSKVSTGQAGRHGYYITPVGVFQHTDGILDYRALGTFNENHIRGLGLKGMRVWDFGWQTADRGWIREPDPGEIRLLMHATDPDYLERRLGRPASEGCVRIPATMNRFLDMHGVLDADYEHDAPDDRRVAAVLLPGRQPSPLAGDALVVFDSSENN